MADRISGHQNCTVQAQAVVPSQAVDPPSVEQLSPEQQSLLGPQACPTLAQTEPETHRPLVLPGVSSQLRPWQQSPLAVQTLPPG